MTVSVRSGAHLGQRYGERGSLAFDLERLDELRFHDHTERGAPSRGPGRRAGRGRYRCRTGRVPGGGVGVLGAGWGRAVRRRGPGPRPRGRRPSGEAVDSVTVVSGRRGCR
ncbi:hypothetical protein GUY61_11370 [Streptomyces sp. GC420]|nr:hypothetical protein [Streptomyces sp. GC420]